MTGPWEHVIELHISALYPNFVRNFKSALAVRVCMYIIVSGVWFSLKREFMVFLPIPFRGGLNIQQSAAGYIFSGIRGRFASINEDFLKAGTCLASLIALLEISKPYPNSICFLINCRIQPLHNKNPIRFLHYWRSSIERSPKTFDLLSTDLFEKALWMPRNRNVSKCFA